MPTVDPTPEPLEIKADERGKLVVAFKFPGTGQCFYSTTKPGGIRGNHYHLRKIETFCVIEGKGRVRLRNRDTGEIKECTLSGEKPETIAMPINWAHNITNIEDKEMKLLVWVNEVFDPKDPDTYHEEP